MSRNGSGTYSLPVNSWNPANNGTPATAADYQALINDVAAAITQSLSKDGQTAMTGNLPAGGNKITGLAAGTTSGDSVRYEQLAPDSLGVPVYAMLRSYLAGCTMSTAGSSTTMSFAAGVAMDSTNAYIMTLAAISKTTSNWAVGSAAGGKSLAAAIANNTWYHFYVIRRPDTGVVDVCFSTNASGLLAADFAAGGGNVPDAYTQFRRIGSGKTNGSAQWTSFIQNGDNFEWVAAPLDLDYGGTFPAASTLYTVSVPTGLKVEGMFTLFKTQGTSGMVNFWNPALGAIGASTTVTPLGKGYSDGASGASINSFRVITNTSAQIYGGATAGSQTLKMVCEGWIDTRGRDV